MKAKRGLNGDRLILKDKLSDYNYRLNWYNKPIEINNRKWVKKINNIYNSMRSKDLNRFKKLNKNEIDK